MGADPARFRLAEAGPRALRPLTLDSLGHVMSSTAALSARIARVGVAPIRGKRAARGGSRRGKAQLGPGTRRRRGAPGSVRPDRRAHANKRATFSIAALARSTRPRAGSARTRRQRPRTSVVRWPSGTEHRRVHNQHRPRCHAGVEVYSPRADLAEHPVAFGGSRQLLEPRDQALQLRAATRGRVGKI